jgi:hypothetical protein
MCGIVGVVQYKSEVPRDIRHHALRILFSETLLRTEPRGKDATGVYQVHSDGDWALVKTGKRVSDWIVARREGENEEKDDPIIYPELVESWLEHPMEPTAVVGHCRAATVGSRGKDNNDNHPFAVQLDEKNSILGVHNGTLTNHEVIFDKLPKTLPRHGSVDSESIFHFLYHLTDKGTKEVDGGMLKYLAERLEGAYAVIMMNSRFPEQVVTFRRDRPMEYFMIAPLNIVVIASEKKFVEAALEKYEFIRQFIPEYRELPKLTYLERTLLERDYRIFDAKKDWPHGRPIHGDFDKISTSGEMLKHGIPILADWKGPEKASTTGTGTKTYSTTSGGSSGGSRIVPGAKSSTPTGTTAKSGETGGVKTTKPADKTKIAAIPASVPNDDDVVEVDGRVIEVPIGGDEDTHKGMERAAAIGLRVRYEKNDELADSLGMTVQELREAGKTGLAVVNRLADLHFNLGYSVAAAVGKKEMAEARRKSGTLTGKMEHLADKQQKAQTHIWEHRQVIAILYALHRGDYQMSSHNIELALSAFPEISEEKRKSLLRVAEDILNDQGTQKLATKLVERFRAAEAKQDVKSKETS